MKKISLLWTLLFMVACGYLAHRISQGSIVETDIFTIIPDSNIDSDFKEAANLYSKQQENKIIWLFEKKYDSKLSRSKASSFSPKEMEWLMQIKSAISNSPSIQSMDTTSTKIQAFYQEMSRFKHALLSETDQQQLSNDNAQAHLSEALQANFIDAFSMGTTQRFSNDPFGFYESFINASLPTNTTEQFDEFQIIEYKNKAFLFIILKLDGSVFDETLQDEYYQLESIVATLSEQHNILFQANGILIHSARTRIISQNEISRIGTISTIGILLLFAFAFRSVTPMLLALSSLICGISFATALSLLIFHKIHILTLIFGASVIGIAIDYAFHFFAHAYQEKQSGQQTVQHIRTALFLGYVSSMIGFGSLSFTQFPALSQLSIFAIGGLTGAFLSVLGWFQFFPRSLTLEKQTLLIPHPLFPWFAKRPKAIVYVLALTALSAIALWFTPKTYDDDIRLLRIHFPDLEDNRVLTQSLFKQKNANGFFIVKGETIDSLLVATENLTRQLQPLADNNLIGHINSPTIYTPSLETMLRTHQLKNRLLSQDQFAETELSQIGLKPKIIEQYLNDAQSFDKEKYAEALPRLLSLSPAKHLWLGKVEQHFFGLVTVSTKSNSQDWLESLTLSSNQIWYDKISTINQLFSNIRTLATQYLAFAYAFILMLLCIRYGLKRGVATILPSLSALIITFLCLAVAGISINLFHVLATIIVLAVGMDFSLFMNETKTNYQPALLACALSAITTLLAFGLLAFSNTSALAAFGQVIFIGIMVVFLLSPVVVSVKPKHE